MRTAVDVKHRRHRAGRLAGRARHVHRHAAAVTRGDALEAAPARDAGRHVGVGRADVGELAAGTFHHAVARRHAVRQAQHQQPPGSQAVAAFDHVHAPRQRAVHGGLRLHHGGVEPARVDGVQTVAPAQQLATRPVDQRLRVVAHVKALGRKHGRQLRRGALGVPKQQTGAGFASHFLRHKQIAVQHKPWRPAVQARSVKAGHFLPGVLGITAVDLALALLHRLQHLRLALVVGDPVLRAFGRTAAQALRARHLGAQARQAGGGHAAEGIPGALDHQHIVAAVHRQAVQRPFGTQDVAVARHHGTKAGPVGVDQHAAVFAVRVHRPQPGDAGPLAGLRVENVKHQALVVQPVAVRHVVVGQPRQ
jgi:hypothetical protein